jgi:hypothetical protein
MLNITVERKTVKKKQTDILSLLETLHTCCRMFKNMCQKHISSNPHVTEKMGGKKNFTQNVRT